MSEGRADTGLADTAAAAAVHPYGPDAKAAARTERQLALLDGIAEHGAALIHVIRKQAEQANWCGAEGPAMYERLARAVRQTMAFANKIDAEARLTAEQRAAAHARREGAEGRALLRNADRALSTLSAEFGQIAKAIDQETDPAGLADPGAGSDRENLLGGLHERFGDKSVDDELNGRTYGEILNTIIEDIGGTPDLSVFTAEEMARVYGPALLRRRAAARVARAAAAAGDGGAACGDADGGDAGASSPQQGAPDVANGPDPP